MVSVVPHLIMTVDYELFGNGSGCLEQCVVAPTERMLDVAGHSSAVLTFFVETTEFMAMEAAGVSVDAVRGQVARAVARGHDAQLHVHPQWEGALRTPEATWQVNNARWRIGDLAFEDIRRLLSEGQTWLKELVSLPDYRVLAFRAGGWCIQPSTMVIRALLDLGFLVDSTVAPGFYNAMPGEWSDFRRVPAKSYWRTDGDVGSESSVGLWEVPIVSGRISRWRHYRGVKQSRVAGDGGMAPGCHGDYRGPDGFMGTLLGRIGKLRRLGLAMLDFSTMPSSVLISLSEQWLAMFGDVDGSTPLVAIAHTKNFTEASARHMEEYLAWAERNGFEFSTYGRWLESLGS